MWFHIVWFIMLWLSWNTVTTTKRHSSYWLSYLFLPFFYWCLVRCMPLSFVSDSWATSQTWASTPMTSSPMSAVVTRALGRGKMTRTWACRYAWASARVRADRATPMFTWYVSVSTRRGRARVGPGAWSRVGPGAWSRTHSTMPFFTRTSILAMRTWCTPLCFVLKSWATSQTWASTTMTSSSVLAVTTRTWARRRARARIDGWRFYFTWHVSVPTTSTSPSTVKRCSLHSLPHFIVRWDGRNCLSCISLLIALELALFLSSHYFPCLGCINCFHCNIISLTFSCQLDIFAFCLALRVSICSFILALTNWHLFGGLTNFLTFRE